jgi:hypothetical protein
MQSKPILGALSRKLEKHGLLSELPMFRMKSEDIDPLLGSVNFSPAYLYLKKHQGRLSEIEVIRVSLGQKFVEKLSELSGLDFTEKVKLDMQYHWGSYLYKNDVHE